MDVPIGAIITAGRAAWDLYMKCSIAKNDFRDMTNHCLNVHIAMKKIESSLSEANFQGSIAAVGDGESLNVIVTGCGTSLDELDQKVRTYNSLSSTRKALWDRIKFAQQDLNKIRGNLTLHLAALSAFADGVQMSSLARIEDRLQDLVQMIKRGDKEPTILSVHAVEDEDQWETLKDELMGEGVTLAELEQHRHIIKEKIREVLDESDADGDTVYPEDSISVVETSQHPASTWRAVAVGPRHASALGAIDEDGRNSTETRPVFPETSSPATVMKSTSSAIAYGHGDRPQQHTEPDAASHAKLKGKLKRQSMRSEPSDKLIQSIDASRHLLGSGPEGYGGVITAMPKSPLHRAALLGELNLVESILHFCDDQSKADNSLSNFEHKVSQFSQLHEADESGRIALHYAAMGGNDKVFSLIHKIGGIDQLLRKDELGNTCLIIGAALGYDLIVQEICESWQRTRGKRLGHDGLHMCNDSGYTALYVAIVSDFGVITTCLLEHGATLQADTRDASYEYIAPPSFLVDPMDKPLTPLLLAAIPGRPNALHATFRYISSLESKSVLSALRVAVWTGNVAGVDALLDHVAGASDDDQNTSRLTTSYLLCPEGTDALPTITYAIVSAEESIIRLLVSRGADINLACRMTPPERRRAVLPILHLYSNSKNLWTPLELAIYVSEASVVALLIRLGAYKNAKVTLELELAVRYGELSIITMLDPSRRPTHVTDFCGQTALTWAVQDGEYSEVLKLLDSGSAVDHYSYFESLPIHDAVMRDKSALQVVELLLDRGSPVNVKNNRDLTPLMQAALSTQLDVIKLLIGSGADVHELDYIYGSVLTKIFYNWLVEDADRMGSTLGAALEPGQPGILKPQNGRLDVIRTLVEAGVPLHVCVPRGQWYGKTALQIVKAYEWDEAVKILKDAEDDSRSRNSISKNRLRSMFRLRRPTFM